MRYRTFFCDFRAADTRWLKSACNEQKRTLAPFAPKILGSADETAIFPLERKGLQSMSLLQSGRQRCLSMWKKLFLAIACLIGFAVVAPLLAKEAQPLPSAMIDLSTLGYRKANAVHVSDKEAFRNSALFMQDDQSRLSFVSPNTLAVYFTLLFNGTDAETRPSSGYQMEAFFVDVDARKLIKRQNWNTLKRQWFNDSYDTEGRVIEVHNGFLVHAGGMLELYTPDLRLVNKYNLCTDEPECKGMWSVKAAPGGDVIYVQPFAQLNQVRRGTVSYFAGAGEANGRWLRSESFQKIGNQNYFGGPDSISNNAIVTEMAHCLDLQGIGEPSHHLSCSNPVAYGFPTFLNDREILSVHDDGFSVLSTEGTEIWTKGGSDPSGRRTFFVGSHRRSMDGARFAVSLSGSKKVEFDGVRLARGPFETIVVYDEKCRQRVFNVTYRIGARDSDFALSPDGRTLAVLAGAAINVYKLPDANCR